MKKLNLDKSHIIFYVTTISFVLFLFKVVSTYGENNLKASPAISGLYQLQSSSLPTCLKNQALSLEIEQSGLFLFAKLAKIPLDGRIKDKQITLTGKPTTALSDCSFSQNTGLQIQASVTDETLSGEINWDQTKPKTSFIAKREVVKESPQKSH